MSRATLMNPPITRLWFAYRFDRQTSFPLQEFFGMITLVMQQLLWMQICFDCPAKVTPQWPPPPRRFLSAAASTHATVLFWSNKRNSLICLFVPADWRRSLSRWISPARVSPRRWCQPRPSTRQRHLLPRRPPSSPCRRTTPPTPSAAAPDVASWRGATP